MNLGEGNRLYLLRIIGVLILCVLPGAWLTFGLSLPGVSLVARALLAVAASPVVLVAQFYGLRFIGLPFATVALVMVFGNLAALLLVRRRWSKLPPLGSLAGVLPYVLFWALPIGVLLRYFRDPAEQASRAHFFLHADVVYGLANGVLKLEEAQLAGLTLGYPWGGHVQQALLSWVWNTAPVANFQWTNFILLIACVGLMAHVTGRLGGGLRARLLTMVLVLLAVNALGYTLRNVVSPELVQQYPIWGDSRFTPWLRKYALWNQHPHGHVLFTGILYFMFAPRSEAYSKSAVALVSILAAGLAVIYPTFMPAVGALILARPVADYYEGQPATLRATLQRAALPLGFIALVSLLMTVGTLAVVGEHRAAGTGMSFSGWWGIRRKTIASAISLSPLLLGVGVLLFARWKESLTRWSLPLLGGLASVVLYVAFTFVDGIEYKFMFTAAMCLAPLAALGIDGSLSRPGRARHAGYALLLLFLVAAGADKMIGETGGQRARMVLRVDEFALRLAEGHELHPSVEAIRTGTAANTIVVVDSVDVHLPTFVQRSLFAPPHTEAVLSGAGQRAAHLLANNRGYGSEVVDRRQGVTRRLFRSRDSADRLAALREIQRLERPVVVLLDVDRHSELMETLVGAGSGRVLHTDRRWAAWLSERPAPGSEGEPSR